MAAQAYKSHRHTLPSIMDLASSWIDVEAPPNSMMMMSSSFSDCCPLPVLVPRFDPPHDGLPDFGAKAELHRVLHAVQFSHDYGVHFCESFRDPRRHSIDDYWYEVKEEAISTEELHRAVGKVDTQPLSDEARTGFHQLARLLERLVRRIDRVVLAP